MKENIYDNENFFKKYSEFPRSVKGLSAAGEWHELKKMLPTFFDKDVLDLGCGFGWHCIYAAKNKAKYVLGTDISEKMLEKAREKTTFENVEYKNISIEDYEYPADTFDIVISSLALHYISDFKEISQKVYKTLRNKGSFIFSVEHPIFTAYGTQEWEYDENGNPKYWPVDNYFYEGKRKANFLGEEVVKYHKTLTTYINGLLEAEFIIKEVIEPKPSDELLKSVESMKDELRRPMMLLISAQKN